MQDGPAALGRAQQRQLARFERIGLSARPMSDGRCLLVALPVGPAPFEGLGGPFSVKRILFSTVGDQTIKCLRPRPLFSLPLIDLRQCADATAIEWTIRQAWRSEMRRLRDTQETLAGLGLDVQSDETGTALAFPLPGEAPDARILVQRPGEFILPSTGPLAGLALASREERVLAPNETVRSGADLGCQIGGRVSELESIARDRALAGPAHPAPHKPAEVPLHPSTVFPAAASKRSRSSASTAPPRAHRTRASHQPKVLVVGSGLVGDADLRTALAEQGYRVATSHSEAEALMRLASMSPDLVISQYALGRSDGASLVASMNGLVGIERIPVVLLDEGNSDGRREAARAVGAAGYLVSPPSADRFVARLAQLVEAPTKRRFTRYPRRLSAHLEGLPDASLVTEVGRGGVFIRTPDRFEPESAMQCEMTIPELGRSLRFEGQVLYTGGDQGENRQGLGLRFFDISAEDEAALIEYLGWLESRGDRRA